MHSILNLISSHIQAAPIQCPECAKKGQIQYLRFHFLSLSESVEKCNLSTCMYPFSRFRYRNYHDQTVYRYERVPAALVVQTEPEPSANDTKELLDTFNLNWLDEPGECDNYNTPQETSISDYSFNETGLNSFLSMVNESVTNPYDIEAIINDICKESTHSTSSPEEEEYTILELKSFTKPNLEVESIVPDHNSFSDLSEVPTTTTHSPAQPSPPTRSVVPADSKAAPAKPQKNKGRHKKHTESSFKFNIIRSSTTSSSSSSSSSEAPRSDFPSTKDNIPKLSKCLAQIHSITAQVSASSSSSSASSNPSVNATNLIKRDYINSKTQLKTILEQQHHIRPIDLMHSLNSIDFIPETSPTPTSMNQEKTTRTLKSRQPRKAKLTQITGDSNTKRKHDPTIERPFLGFTKKDLNRPKRLIKQKDTTQNATVYY